MHKEPVLYTKIQFIQDIMYVTGWSKTEAYYFVSEMDAQQAICPDSRKRIRQLCKEMGYQEDYFHNCIL